MLNAFRSFAGSFTIKVMLIMLILSFAIWGIDDMVRQTGSHSSIAKVGGESVSAREYEIELKRATESLRRAMGDHFSPEMIRITNLHMQVLQKLISQKLLAMESERLGLVPSDTDVVRQIHSSPMFQDKKGNFDKAHFNAMLRNNNLSEKTYVGRLRRDMATDLLVSSLISNVSAPEAAAKTMLAAREEQRNSTLYVLSPSMVNDVPQPDAKALTDYFNAHADRFTAPEYRNLSYVVISPGDTQGKASTTEDELRKAYRERSDEFKRPERRAVEQLLFSSEENAKNAYNALKDGKAFEQVAAESNIINKGSISLGKIGKNAIIENAADTVFSLPAAGYTEPVESPFGWHIFRVVSIDPPSVSSFEEVRAQLERELSQRNADEAQSKLANRLEDALAAGSTLQEAARELKLTLRSVSAINKQGMKLDGTPASDIPDLDKFVETAFKVEEKSQSSLVASKGGKYYIVQVDSVIQERKRTLDEVRGLVVSSWQDDERTRRLAELAKNIAAKFATSEGRNSVIAQYGLNAAGNVTMKRSTRTAGSITLPPALVEDVFSQPAGKSTQSYPTEKGQYVLAVVNNIIPMGSVETDPKLKEALKETSLQLARSMQNEILAEYTRHLSNQYNVSIDEAALEAVTP